MTKQVLYIHHFVPKGFNSFIHPEDLTYKGGTIVEAKFLIISSDKIINQLSESNLAFAFSNSF